jgi:chlorobactene glucosyltransferase
LQELKHSPQGDRLRVVQGEELPPGWAGKPYAVAQGAALAQGRWFCFVDADTFASPQMLAATLATAQGYDADMFSMLTDQELKTFWEKVILPIIFTALSVGFPANRVNDPHAPEAIANGQFILIRREVYDVVGGHAAIRDQIAEDKALAELVKRCGYRLVLADGRAVARTRMYTTFAEIWEGWTKNIFLGMEGRFGLLLVGALVGLMGAFLLPVWLLGAIAWLLLRGGFLPAVALVQALLVWAYVLWLRAQAARAFHISPWYAFSFPLGTLAFTAMMFASAFKVLSGQGVTWKGRRYSG